MIWVHRNIEAKQVPVDHADVTAVLVRLSSRLILVFSVYMPSHDPNDVNALEDQLQHIQETTRIIRRDLSPQTVELIIAGDFNRHDQLWGGDDVGATARQGEAAPIIDFMEDFDLQCLLPRGTITYESEQGDSTIAAVNCFAGKKGRGLAVER
jgi:Endonuclease-reverse transcriptase